MDEVITAPGANNAPPASPANAGTPPAEEAGAKGESTKTQPEKPANSFYARQRILERENAKLKAEQEKNKPANDDDDLDPDEAEVVKKVVDKHYGPQFEEMDTRMAREEIDKAIKASPYDSYMDIKDRESVQKLAFDPQYGNLPVEDLIYLALKPKMTQISAEMARKASEKINDTQLPRSGSSTGTTPKSVLEMNDAEYAEYRKQNGIR